jgi:hypothetical protein
MASRKTDSVLLVALTVFVGYLFVTRRLQAVFDVLKGPAPGATKETATGGQIVPQGQGGLGIPKATWQYTPPFNPSSGGFHLETGGSDPYTSNPANLPPKWGRYTP